MCLPVILFTIKKKAVSKSSTISKLLYRATSTVKHCGLLQRYREYVQSYAILFKVILVVN